MQASRSKALDAYASGLALHDRLQAELMAAAPDGAILSNVGAIEANRMVDGLSASLTAISLEAVEDAVKSAAGSLALNLTGLRSAIQVAAVATRTRPRGRASRHASENGWTTRSVAPRVRAAAQGQPAPPTSA